MKLTFLRKRNSDRRRMYSAQDKDNLVWLWRRYLKQKTLWLLVILGLILLQGGVYQQFLKLTENGLRVIFENGSPSDLVRVCLTVFALFAVRGLVSYVVPRLSIWVASDAVQKLRTDLIEHLMTLDLAYFERTNAGEIILRLVNQAQDLSQFVGLQTANAVRDATTVVIVSGYLLYRSPLLFTAAVVVVPIILLMMQLVSKSIKDIMTSAENALGAYMNGIEEMSNGMRTVKISGQEEYERDRLVRATSIIKDLSIRLQSAQALILPSMDLVAAFAYMLVIGGGGYMVLSPDYDMDGAGIITFLLGLALVFEPARSVANFLTRLQANLVILGSVRSLFHERPTIVDKPDALSEFDTAGDIELKNVTFSYDPASPLFEDLNMQLPGGKITAIVGATGSGKTTILSLLARLYNVQGGEISIGGIPINDLKIKTLRQSFSAVAQDIVIFNNSIWENIKYVRPEATDEEIWAAAEAAEIADLIRARGDLPLGPKGSQLSGGQKQRIAIARAFLRSAPILLLDEATSALDQRTEDRVKGALARLSRGKTTIIVAHRLSAITHADLIYVLDVGKVVEQGTHEELMAMGGLYAGMYGAQKESYNLDAPAPLAGVPGAETGAVAGKASGDAPQDAAENAPRDAPQDAEDPEDAAGRAGQAAAAFKP